MTMQAIRILLLAHSLASIRATKSVEKRSQVTPVQKVLQLMEGMIAKGKEEKHKEEVQFAAYKQWCDDITASKKSSIEEAKEQVEILNADIAKAEAMAKQLTKEISEHEQDIAVWKGDIAAATKVREMDKMDYDTLHEDYSESVDALERAIDVLKKQDYDRKQAASEDGESFVQVRKLTRLALIPQQARKALDQFLAQDLNMLQAANGEQTDEQTLEQTSVAAPEANAYEFQSSGIITMLENLLKEFIAKRTELEQTEMKSKHAYTMLIADLNSGISKAESAVTTKTDEKAKQMEMKADAEGDLTETSDTLSADTKYLADVTATCQQKESDFQSRQALRAEELEAIEKAIEIISDSTVSGAADKYLPSMLQEAHTNKPSLAMLRALSNSEATQRVAAYLRKRSSHLHSHVLSLLAVRVSNDPFEKVKKMIKDLLVRLMDEANAEAEHKGWCDTELASNEHVRKEKTAAVEQLKSEIDELTASIAKLGESIAELSQAVAELDASMAEQSELREEEKSKNEQTIKDSQEAEAAVSEALLLLKDFYAKASEATSFVQRAKQPEIFDSPYTGMQGMNGGVVGMLEVIQSDFARLESETKAAEASSMKEYEVFMTDSKVDKTAKVKDVEFKTNKKEDESSELDRKKQDLENTQSELEDALNYFEKLKPSCVDADVSYEDRVARREQEIESLKEALKILNGADLAD